VDSRAKGTYLQGTAEELQFLPPGRSYGWRLPPHNLQEKCCREGVVFCFSPPMTKANQAPPGSENPGRVLGSSGPAEGTQKGTPAVPLASTPSPHWRVGRCNHLTPKFTSLAQRSAEQSIGQKSTACY